MKSITNVNMFTSTSAGSSSTTKNGKYSKHFIMQCTLGCLCFVAQLLSVVMFRLALMWALCQVYYCKYSLFSYTIFFHCVCFTDWGLYCELSRSSALLNKTTAKQVCRISDSSVTLQTTEDSLNGKRRVKEKQKIINVMRRHDENEGNGLVSETGLWGLL